MRTKTCQYLVLNLSQEVQRKTNLQAIALDVSEKKKEKYKKFRNNREGYLFLYCFSFFLPAFIHCIETEREKCSKSDEERGAQDQVDFEIILVATSFAIPIDFGEFQ